MTSNKNTPSGDAATIMVVPEEDQRWQQFGSRGKAGTWTHHGGFGPKRFHPGMVKLRVRADLPEEDQAPEVAPAPADDDDDDPFDCVD